MLLTVEYGT